MEYNDIKKFFSENQIVKVTFTKKNGSIRVMECTTNLYLVPFLSQHPKRKEATEVQEEEIPLVYNVYDLEKFAWRSFTIENVISIETV